MNRHRDISICVLVALCVLGTALVSAGSDEKQKSLSPEKRKELQKLVAEFRRNRRNHEARAIIADAAIEIGAAAADRLLALINTELHPQLSAYRQRFYKAAIGQADKKFRRANWQEVFTLRSQVLSLRLSEQLTKQMIVSQADPAMKRLAEIVVLDRDTVLRGAAPLRKRRATMVEVGLLWEKCVTSLSSQAEQGDPARGDRPGQQPSFEQYLQAEEELAVRLAVPMSPQTRAVLAANARLAAKIDPEEARCVLTLNLMRNLLGLSPLRIDLTLAAAARDHSADMEKLKFFSHRSPVPGKQTPADRAGRFGTTASAENIAVGPFHGNAANSMWFHSPGHHRNMLSDHVRVGVGRSGRYWTELFGK